MRVRCFYSHVFLMCLFILQVPPDRSIEVAEVIEVKRVIGGAIDL